MSNSKRDRCPSHSHCSFNVVVSTKVNLISSLQSNPPQIIFLWSLSCTLSLSLWAFSVWQTSRALSLFFYRASIAVSRPFEFTADHSSMNPWLHTGNTRRRWRKMNITSIVHSLYINLKKNVLLVSVHNFVKNSPTYFSTCDSFSMLNPLKFATALSVLMGSVIIPLVSSVVVPGADTPLFYLVSSSPSTPANLLVRVVFHLFFSFLLLLKTFCSPCIASTDERRCWRICITHWKRTYWAILLLPRPPHRFGPGWYTFYLSTSDRSSVRVNRM